MNRTTSVALLFIVSGLLFSGCSSVAPLGSSISAPDTLQVNERATFIARIESEGEIGESRTYNWEFGDASTGTGLRVNHAYASPGTYEVLFRQSNESGADSAYATVEVLPGPQPPQIISVSPRKADITEGDSIQFDSKVAGTKPITHRWIFGDRMVIGENPTHTFNMIGRFQAVLVASNVAGRDAEGIPIQVNRSLYDRPERDIDEDVCSSLSDLNTVFFGRNSSTLSEKAKNELRDNTEVMIECPNVDVQVEGYASPNERNPEPLARDRAQAVVDFYTRNEINLNRLRPLGKGVVGGIPSKKAGNRGLRRAESIPLSKSKSE